MQSVCRFGSLSQIPAHWNNEQCSQSVLSLCPSGCLSQIPAHWNNEQCSQSVLSLCPSGCLSQIPAHWNNINIKTNLACCLMQQNIPLNPPPPPPPPRHIARKLHSVPSDTADRSVAYAHFECNRSGSAVQKFNMVKTLNSHTLIAGTPTVTFTMTTEEEKRNCRTFQLKVMHHK